MSIELNQNVSAVLHLGPMVDPVSALPVSTLTLAAADSKNWMAYDITGPLTSYNLSAYLMSQTTSGFYRLHLSAGTVSILGTHQFQLTDNSLILPYAIDIDVVHSSYWGRKFGASALDVRVVSFAANALSGPAIGTGAISALKIGSNVYFSIGSAVLSMALGGMNIASTLAGNLISTMNMVSIIDPNVDAILVDTDTTIPGLIGTFSNANSTHLEAISAALGTFSNTNSTHLEALSAAIGTIDGNVDLILADTGTDGVAIAAGAIDTTQFAAGAIDAAALAADAATEIADKVWATILESEGSVTAKQVMQVGLATLAGATLSAASGLQFLTPNSAAVRVSVPSIVSGLRSSVTLAFA